MPFPCRITSGISSQQLITVEGSNPPGPPSITRSTFPPNFSSISSGSVTYSMSSPSSSGRVVVMIGASRAWQISRIIGLSGTRMPTVHTCVFADVAQVVADDGQVVFPWVDAFQLADTLDGTLLQGMASDGIHGVGGVDDDSSFVQYVCHPLDVFGTVVL